MTEPGDNRPENRQNRLSEYADQCFLMDFIDHFSGLKGSQLSQDYMHFGMVHPEKQTSTMFLNNLLQTENGQLLLEKLPKSLAGDLQPYIRLYLSVGSGQKEQLLPLPFNNFEEMDSLTKSIKPGLGVGIKSFTFDYLGNQPIEVDYWINCELNLYFESPRALFQEYSIEVKNPAGSTNTLTYSFADLIKRTKKYKPDTLKVDPNIHLRYDPANFRIRIEVGYKPPSERVLRETTNLNKIEQEQLKKALLNAKISFYLTLLKHTVKPRLDDPSGAFEMAVTYNGALESTFLSPKTNVLISETLADISAQRTHRKALVDEAREAALVALNASSGHKGSFTKEKLEKLAFDDIIELKVSARGGATHQSAAAAVRTGMQGGRNVEIADIDTDEIFEQLGIEDKPQQTKLISNTVVEFLRSRRMLRDYEEETGAAKEKELIEVYGRMLRTLGTKGLIYNMTMSGEQLLAWQKDRESYDVLTEAQMVALQSEITPEKAKANPHAARRATDKLVANQRNQTILSASKKRFGNILLKKNIEISQQKREWTSTGPRPIEGTVDGYGGEILEAQKEAVEAKDVEKKQGKMTELEELNRNKELEEGDDRTIYWFYYGDLLDTAVEILAANSRDLDIDLWNKNSLGSQIKILLGDIDYLDPETGTIKKVNIARVPISLNTYSEWWTNKVIKPLKETYVFKAFLRDSITSLVKHALTNRCRRGGQPALRVRLSTDFITLDETKPVNFQQTNIAGDKDSCYYFSAWPQKLSIAAANELQVGYRSGDIMFIYAPSSRPTFLDEHKKNEDVKNGIYHFVLGKEDTPVINASFSKNDQPYFLEAKAERNGILNDTVQLSEPYHCDMTLYGNATFRPGRLVHIRFPVTWFGYPSDPLSNAKILGLGGYFHINKASNAIKLMGSKLEWTTDLTMLWQSFGKEGKAPKANIPAPITVEASPVARQPKPIPVPKKVEEPC